MASWEVGLAEKRKSARGERSERGRRRGRERWGLHPLRRLVTPFESVRLLPPGGYSQSWVGEKKEKLALALAGVEVRCLRECKW